MLSRKIPYSVAEMLTWLVLLSSFLIVFFSIDSSASPENLYMQVNVFDAKTRNPLQNATVIFYDVSSDKSVIKFTNEFGSCIFSSEFGHTYYVYAYKGDFACRKIEYAPNKRTISIKSFEPITLDLPLVPGAMIELEGELYLVELPSPMERAAEITLINRDPHFNYTFIRDYGRSKEIFYLGLSDKIVIVPADTPIDLKVRTSVIWIEERTGIPRQICKEFYIMDAGGASFLLTQGEVRKVSISPFSLRRSIEDVRLRYEGAISRLKEAQNFGFMVFDEIRALANINQHIIEAETFLREAKDSVDFEKAWLLLRESLGRIEHVSKVISDKFFIAETNTAYISAIMAIFSVILAFFFFEDAKKKILSCFLFYFMFIVTLYMTYPGAHIIIDRNAVLFIWSSIPSFAAVLFIVFGLPRIWKERNLEGEVSWRSALSIIFSMGKRQIKRKKIRGFFTIFSICILILCFTALTSFGTAFGVISERVDAAPISEGVMVKRGAGEISLGYGDISLISSRVGLIQNASLRFKSPLSLGPIARIRSASGREALIFGVLAISPTNESIYTQLDESIDEGFWLSDDAIGESLISVNMAKMLETKNEENITLEILGTAVSVELVVKGLINDQKYNGLKDLNGDPFGPLRKVQSDVVRACNSTETIVINLKTADFIQSRIDESGSQLILTVPSEIVFRFAKDVNIEETAKKIVQLLNCEVFVSQNNVIKRYRIGVYIEMKGVAELLIPIIMVVLNTTMVMINSAYERNREIRVLSTLGLNPTHIGLTFVAEAVVLGMVGGSLGYIAGLGFLRTMLLFGHDLMVREKLEWWWSALGFALAIVVSLISVTRPAIMIVNTYTPSKVKRIKRTEEEKIIRREEIFKIYQAREFSMPLKVPLNEKDFFINFFLDSLRELSAGYMERTENIEELPEIENTKREIVKEIKFNYYSGIELSRGTKNTLILTKSPIEDYYRVKLISEPLVIGSPETVVERSVSFVHNIILSWIKNRKKIVGT